jgi:ABC-2 type transport system permease protein
MGKDGQMEAGAGPFSRLARAQYAALGAMRWWMVRSGLRSIHGVLDLGATGISLMIYSFMGLGLGIGLGVGAFFIASHETWRLLLIEFWIVCIVWQTVPLALASFERQFDMSGLLRFPVNFSAYFLLYVIFGLLDISTILGGMCCLGIWSGIALARPGMAGWTALALAVFAFFNILLVRAIFAWVDRWLAQRRTREIVSALFLLVVLSLQLLNPAVHQTRHSGPGSHDDQLERYHQVESEAGPLLKTATAVQRWLPPGLAGSAVRQAAEQRRGPALGMLGVLGLYVLAAGAALAARLKAEYRGENLGEAPSRKKTEKRDDGWLLDGAGPVAAVMEKELRTLLRSMPLLYALGAPVLMVFIVGSLFRNGAASHPFQLALPVCVAYGLLGFSRLIYNNLGAEGAGIQMLFLSPTPMRTVLLAKNLFHALLYGLSALIAGVLASLRLGWPPSATVVGVTVAWLLFALPVNLAAGNIFSLTMPYRVNPGRMTLQGGSAGSALLSMVVQMIALGVGGAVFGLCILIGKLWLTIPILLAMAVAAVFAWVQVLRKSDALANQHKDTLLATLSRTE